MRVVPTIWVVCGFLLVSCSRSPDRGSEQRAATAAQTQALISDQFHGDGTRGFAWLPPMVEHPRLEGSFDNRLSPRVDIDELDADQQPVRHLVTFTRESPAVGETIKVNGDHYHVNWHTRSFDVRPGRIYRIKVSIGSRALGVADAWLLDDGSNKNQIDSARFVALVAGQTLPIKFFLNRCAPVVCAASDQCHEAGLCDLDSGLCTNPLKADGSRCSDGNACTQTDTCQQGTCLGARPVACADSDQCHDPGVCDPGTGLCSNPAKPDGSSCSDGSACTRADSCQAGTCTGADPVECSASDQCHTAGVCDPDTGLCSDPEKADGEACSDGNACTRSDSCRSGACVGTSPVVCTASDQCHLAGACNSATGACSDPAKADGTSCSDGNACTRTDSCQAGACVGASPVVCTAADQCHVAGVCDPATGICSNAAKADGVSCTDGNACTQTDTCQSGACVGASPVVCAASDQCHDAGTCNPATGACSNSPKADGSSCTDGNACTQTDTCQAGACVGASPVVCTASDQCHDTGVCNPASGACSNPAKANGSACTDGNACTQSDTCQAGGCVGESPVVCTASDQCHDAGACDPASGVCSNPARINGASCSDGNACTQTDTCQAGACVGANPVVCAADPCHETSICDSVTGQCSGGATKPDGTTCHDGTVCNGAEVCQSGVCTAGIPIRVDDRNPCTVDTCDPVTGPVHTPITGCTGLPDLTVSSIAPGVTADPVSFQITGSVTVTIANQGQAPADRTFTVIVFEDRNLNKTYDQESDVQLGQTSVPSLAAGASLAVNVTASGEVLFPGNLISAYVDAGQLVRESNETNNFGDSTPACIQRPAPDRPLRPTLKWAWSSADCVDPQHDQVIMAPTVADLDGDHVPEVVFVSYQAGPIQKAPGRLRAVDGRTGKCKVTFALPVNWLSSVAIGDLDRDGRPEVVATDEAGDRLIAFENDGTLKWISPIIPMPAGFFGIVAAGGQAIADLDGDGAPEVIIGSVVLSGSNGTIIWAGQKGRGDKTLTGSFFSGPLSVVADLDLDGQPEVVTGNTAYRRNGQIFWDKSSTEPDGYPAVGNFDSDPFPEIVVTVPSAVRLYQHDGTLTWSRMLPDLRVPGESCHPGMGGAPTIGDADGDGHPDIGVAGCTSYTVFRGDGTILWTRRITDLSSGITSSTMFDFVGDGSTEIVFADELDLQVVDGKTGKLLFGVPNPNGTFIEQPIVADVDGDGKAEIVAAANNALGTPGPTGLRVFTDVDDGWVSTRPIWNQHSYHVTNVNADLTIPVRETNSWQAGNNYRVNTLDLGCPWARADLIASHLRLDDAFATVRVGNAGSLTVRSGVNVTFYDGDPLAGGLPIGTTQTQQDVRPGQYEDVTLSIGTPPETLWASVDDRGGLHGAITEIDELNNLATVPGANRAPTVRLDPAQVTVHVTQAATLEARISDDGLPAPSHLTSAWQSVSGPGTVTLTTPDQSFTDARFSVPGTYTLRITVDDGVAQASAEVVVTVLPDPNTPPVVTCPQGGTWFTGDTIVGRCYATDDGLPSGVITKAWSQVLGPAPLFLTGSPEQVTTSASLPGTYVIRQTATDGALSGFGDFAFTVLPRPPANAPPKVAAGPDLFVNVDVPVSLNGSYTDDGKPAGGTITVEWRTVGGPAPAKFANPASATTTAVFPLTGLYALQLLVSDGQLVSTDSVLVTVSRIQNNPPLVDAGPDQTLTLPTRTAQIFGIAVDDGKPVGGSLTTVWTLVSGPGTAMFADPNARGTSVTFDALGTYVLRFTASDSELVASDTISVTLKGQPPVGNPPTVAITAPTDLTDVTSAIDVRGTVASASLLAWRLEYRDDSQGDSWHTFATGSTAVTDAVLGKLDPTLLLNGIYQLRLVATDTAGRTTITPEQTTALNVRGNLKVGQFALSFQDLSIPVSGIPIQLLRNYDSRDTRKGDFGFGWTLEANGVRVSESGKIGRSWGMVRKPGFFPMYCVEPIKGKRVTVAVAGGRTYEFEAMVDEDDGCAMFFEPSLVTVGFRALPGTTAKLEPFDGGEVLFTEGELRDADFELYDPTTYVLTLLDGTEMVVADATAPEGPGLKSITDTNGNKVTFGNYAITHSSGSGLTINRDSQNRITSIVDPMGSTYFYAYDLNGNLATDPVGNITRFKYEIDLVHHLKDIIDPRGVRAMRNDYDDDGRLISTTDAAGKVIAYTHDIANRRELVVNRTGDTTTFEYDGRGNVTKETDAEGGITERTFDAHDNMLTRKDPNGQTWTYTYDENDLESSMTDPLGKTTVKTYTPTLGRLSTETDPLGHTTRHGYYQFGNLTSTTDALNHTTTYVYNTQGDLTLETDAAGKVTRHQYNRDGFLTRTTDRLGHITDYAYDPNGHRTKETRTRTLPSGQTESLVTSFVYDNNGRVTETQQPDGSVLRTTYNAIGKVATTVDALGRTTSMTYNDLGDPIRTSYPDSTFEETSYDNSGRRTASKDRAGRTTSYEYDRLGRLKKTTFPGGTFTQAGYDPGGRQTSSTDERGKVTTFGYDDADRRTTVTDPLNHTTTYGYDDAGRNTSIRDARGFTTTFSYDDANRRIGTTFPDTTQTTTGYDVLGRRTSETDQAGRTTNFGYDVEGRLTSVTDALEQVTSYAYDELGNRVSQTDANNHVTRFEYDKLGRQTKRILPDGKFETKTYDSQGRVKTRTDFMSRTTTFQYDQADRLTLKTYPDSSTVGFTYTPTGRRLTAVDARGITSYAYDQRDRPTQLTYPDGRRLNYGYDPNGNRTSLTATIGTTSLATTFNYDDRSQVSTVTDPDGRVYTYSHNENGAPTTLAQPNGVTTSYAYDSLNRLKTLVSKHGTTTLASYVYTLGATGLRERVDEVEGVARVYGYDSLRRLISETVTGSGASDYSKTFTYDPVGNRLAQSNTGAVAGGISYAYDSRDRMLSEGSVTDTWDHNGNLISKSGDAVYAWDFEDRLVRVTKADGTVVDHVYNVDGDRVRTTVAPAGGGTPMVRNNLVDTTAGLSQVVAESDAAGQLQAYYVRAGNELLAVRRAPGLACYLKDALGSVRGLADATGLITDTVTYSAFGERLAATGSDLQPYGHSGEPFEAISGFAYHRARWMDPKTGRFLSEDPRLRRPRSGALYSSWGIDDDGAPTTGWVRAPLAYVYSHGDPVNYIDPTGEIEVTILGLNIVVTIEGNLRSIESTSKGLGVRQVERQLATSGLRSYNQMKYLEHRSPSDGECAR